MNKKYTYEALLKKVKEQEKEIQEAKAQLYCRQNALFQTLFTDSCSVKLIIDFESGQIIRANNSACNFYGYSVDELLSMNITQINILPEEQLRVEMQNAKQGNRNHFHFKHKLKNGEIKDVEVHSGKIELDGVVYLYSIIHDITEQKEKDAELKKAKEKAEENEALLKAAMENSQAGIAIVEVPSGKLNYINKAGMQIWQKDYSDICADIDAYMSSWQIFHFDGTPYLPNEIPLARAILYGETCSKEFIVRRENHDDRFVWANAAPVLNASNIQTAAIVVFLDITKRKNTELVIKQNAQRLKIINDLSQLSDIEPGDLYNFALERAIELCDSKIGFLGFLNEDETRVKIHAWSASSMKACEIKDRCIDFEVAKTGIWGEVIRQRNPLIINNYEKENPLKRGIPEGHVPILNYLSIPVFDKGKIVSVLAVGNKNGDYNEGDIQELTLLMDGVWNIVRQRNYEKEIIKAKEEAEESECLFRKLFDDSADAILLIDRTGVFVECNQAALDLLQMPREQFLFMPPVKISPEYQPDGRKSADAAAQMIDIAYEKGLNRFDWTCVNAKGNEFIVEVSLLPILIKGQTMLHVTWRDVTRRKQIEIELAESTERFKVLHNASFGGIAIHDKGIIIDCNQGLSVMTGYSLNELIGMDGLLLIAPQHRELVMNNIVAGYEKPYEANGLRKNGEQFPMRLEARNMPYKGKRIRTVEFRDITASKQAEEKLILSEKTYKEIFNSIEDSLFIHEINTGAILDVNDSMLKNFGYDRSELPKLSIALLSAEEAPYSNEYIGELIRKASKGETVIFEWLNRRKNGDLFHSENILKRVVIAGSEKIMAIVRDITERTQREEEALTLKQSLDLVDGFAFTKDLDLKYVSANHSFCNLSEIPYDKIKGMTDYDIFPPDLAEKYTADDKRIIETAEPLVVEEETVNIKTKQRIILQTRKLPLFDKKGHVIGVYGMAYDVTGLRKAEEALRRSEAIKNKIVSNISDVIVIVDRNGINQYNSSNITKFFGWNPEELVGKNVWDTIHPDDLAVGKCFFNKILIEPNDTGLIEMRYKRKDGIYVWIEVNAINLLYDNDIKGVLCNYHDISERKNAEQELVAAKRNAEESQQKFKAIADTSPLAIYISKGLRQVAEYINPTFHKLFGYSHAEVAEVALWWKLAYPEDEYQKRVSEEWNAKAEIAIQEKSDIVPMETIVTCKDGTKKNILWGFVSTGDENWAFGMDLTAYRKAEKELTLAKEKAEESNRLKTEFLNNMSHEIRTPMNGIIGFSQMLDCQDLSTDKRKYYSKIVQNSSLQLLKIIDDILEISTLETKQEKINVSEFCLNDFIMEIFSIFNLQSKERNIPLYVKKALPDRASYIISDKTKLNKILSNLLENSLKFTYEGFIEFGYFLRKSMLVIYVKDTGIGISPEKHQVIFERFSQENKDISGVYGGLGLGLSISKENARLLGGDIALQSEKGKGSAFYVSIPYKPAQIKDISSGDVFSEYLLQNDNYTILVAEDEEVNYLYIEALFENKVDYNYRLIHVKNGKEAVDLCFENSNIDIILMDLKMPVMNGYEATEKIKSKFPTIPIIAQTAYSTQSDRKLALQCGCDDFISKPIDKEELFGLVNKYLKID